VPALLEVQDVTVRFGGLMALYEVSADIQPGEVVGIIGPNGAGKTTLFNVICGFTRPTGGRLQWKGEALRHHHPRDLARLGIARTLQGLGLFPHLTVLENVTVGASVHSRAWIGSALFALPRGDRDERQLRDRAMRVLADLDISGSADRLPGQLPYGVQKRVALARALVAEPQLLMLDEPASGLSAGEMNELADLLRDMKEKVSVALVEHHMDLVMDVCDRIVVLDFGRVIAAGTPDEVRDDPRVMEAYLGEKVDETTANVAEVDDAAG
jgi:branched-chain amino acid transport system ATP-binding protein